MISIIKKIIKRVFRILTFRPHIYGKLGKHNKFTYGVFINEMAKIGDYNYFGPYSMVNNAVIGNYNSIAPSVKIGQAKHSIDFITTYNKISSKFSYSLFHQPTIIRNDVWIGGNAVIMQGVTIGNGAVIGANAVVTKDVPDFAVVIGCPAKVLKYRFDEEARKLIIESNWWENDIECAAEEIKKLWKPIKEKSNL